MGGCNGMCAVRFIEWSGLDGGLNGVLGLCGMNVCVRSCSVCHNTELQFPARELLTTRVLWRCFPVRILALLGQHSGVLTN